MLSFPFRHLDPPPADHPCENCGIRTIAVCGVLDCAELASLRELGWTLRLEPGQPVFHEGDPAERVFTLTKGVVKLYKLLGDGRRQVTGFLFPGDFLGISNDDEYAFSAETLGETELCWFPRSRFGEFTETHPELERELYRIAAHELAAAQQQMVLLGRKTASERIASFFLMLVDRAERNSGRMERTIDLPMSRSDIADYLGLTKETVSRMLALLKDRRLIRLQAQSRIEMLDRAALEQMAAGFGDY